MGVFRVWFICFMDLLSQKKVGLDGYASFFAERQEIFGENIITSGNNVPEKWILDR